MKVRENNMCQFKSFVYDTLSDKFYYMINEDSHTQICREHGLLNREDSHIFKFEFVPDIKQGNWYLSLDTIPAIGKDEICNVLSKLNQVIKDTIGEWFNEGLLYGRIPKKTGIKDPSQQAEYEHVKKQVELLRCDIITWSNDINSDRAKIKTLKPFGYKREIAFLTKRIEKTQKDIVDTQVKNDKYVEWLQDIETVDIPSINMPTPDQIDLAVNSVVDYYIKGLK